MPQPTIERMTESMTSALDAGFQNAIPESAKEKITVKLAESLLPQAVLDLQDTIENARKFSKYTL